MFRKLENVFKSYIVMYVLFLVLEFIAMYNLVSMKFMITHEDVEAMLVMIPLLVFKSMSFPFVYVFFQMTMYNQLKNMKESFLQYKKAVIFFVFSIHYNSRYCFVEK